MLYENLPQCSFGVKTYVGGAIPHIQGGSLVSVFPLVFCLALEASLIRMQGPEDAPVERRERKIKTFFNISKATGPVFTAVIPSG